jgi:1-acyl-sn-glycerol-3-phosphate acyltransferase
MKDNFSFISYPRKKLIRGALRCLGKAILRILFRLEINGKENFPKSGPLIVVGNHTAVMEAVLMAICSPWQIEMLGAADIPHERISQVFSDLFGFIPVNRGHMDRPALQTALSVLGQKGVIGIFPEGGIWEPGLMRAQTGVAWLSYRGKAPVLPIGFSGTTSALEKALKFKRPNLMMNVGNSIPGLQMQSGIPRKIIFEEYSEQVMSRVRALLLPEDPSLDVKIKNECFDLNITVQDLMGIEQEIPDELGIKHAPALAKFFHRPAILKIFKINLDLPIDALQNLESEHDPVAIFNSIQVVLDYLNNENPYLLAYRFGPKTSEAMQNGLMELLTLSHWVARNGLLIEVTPIRIFFSTEQGKEITQTKQGIFEHWM